MLRYPDWWLFYDWEGDDVGYSSIGLTFKADGTFTSSDNWPGQWTQVEGMLIFKYNDATPIYAGNVIDQAVTGICTIFGVDRGRFYMLAKGRLPTEFTPKRMAGSRDDRGNP